MRLLLGLPLLLKFVASMHIPQDTELLSGYTPSESPDPTPEDDYFEAKSLIDSHLSNSIRNRRSPRARAPESPGLHSQFGGSVVVPFKAMTDLAPPDSEDTATSNSEYMQNIAYSKAHPPKKQLEPMAIISIRKERSVENDTAPNATNDGNNTNNESLPAPSRQYSDGGQWTQAPYDKMNFDDDAVADASTINQGINARAPRVNFITQQKRNMDDDDSSASAPRPEIYREMAVNDRMGDRMLPGPLPYRERERYPIRDPEPDVYPRRFDRYERYNDEPAMPPYYPPYDRDLHPEYYRVHDAFDPYMPRIPTYPDPYYEYPDRRYDVPDTRDYPPVYSNDVEDRYRYMEDRYSKTPARIIYYAHLPDIDRSPPPVDTRYPYRERDYDPYYAPYDPPLLGAYRRPPPPPLDIPRREPMPSSGILKIEDKDRRQDDRIYYDRDGNGGNGSNSTGIGANQESRGYRPADHRSYY